MGTHAPREDEPFTLTDQLRYGQEILKLEGRSLVRLGHRLDESFCRAIELLFACQGNVLVIGMGKAGLVGQKISATLASTGTPSHCVHPAEALHGDLGRIHRDDVALVLSQSGETEEIVRLLPSLADFGVPMVAITTHRNSTLAQAADVVIALGPMDEVCSLGLAPSTSTTAMLALGDALALVTSRRRKFQASDFARFHPGGSLGRRLSKVEQLMRPLDQCRVARDSDTVREILVRCAKPGRRSGAIMLTSADGELSGLFTDSDLARLFERRSESALDEPASHVMTSSCATVPMGTLLADALETIAARKISELPVVDLEGRPRGLIDITDLAGLLPESAMDTQPANLSEPLDPEPESHSPSTVPFRREAG